MNSARTLTVLAAALFVAAWVVADLAVHESSSVLRRAWRSWQWRRCARSWGFPADVSDEVVAAKLRCDAVRLFGVTDAQWREFVDAHNATVGEAS